MASATLAIIISNRDFFPDVLVSEARKGLLALFKSMDIEAVILDAEETKLGGVETHHDAERCADLFHTHSSRIDGVLVSLPNFGDERGVADALRLSRLEVPVLVHAYPDDLHNLHVERRRDAFCGKISVCNNLRQYRIPYSLTQEHVVSPQDASFKADLMKFVRVCRVVKGVSSARLGAIGARPAAFNTVRYSEKLLEDAGISVVTVDLSEIIALAQKLDDKDSRVQAKLAEINSYAQTGDAPPRSLVLMAKLSVIISDWMAENQIDATAIQCWTSIQHNYGVNPCTVMSMMSDKMMPSACMLMTCNYAVVMLNRSPALNCRGVNLVFRHPIGDDDAQLCHQHQRPWRCVPGLRIGIDLCKLCLHSRIFVIQFLRQSDYLGEVDGDDTDPGILQEFFAVAHSVECRRPGSNSAESGEVARLLPHDRPSRTSSGPP